MQIENETIATIADARKSIAMLALEATSNAIAERNNWLDYSRQLLTTGLASKKDPTKLWNVNKEPMYGADGLVWPNAYGLVREDTRDRFGIVTKRYHVLQSSDTAHAIELMFGHMPVQLRPRVVNAGALNNGLNTFVQLDLPNEVANLLLVPGENSAIKPYLTLLNTHGGGSAAMVGGATVRVICKNTFMMASSQIKKHAGLRISHTPAPIKNYHVQVNEWFRELALTYKLQGEFMRAAHSKKMLASDIKKAAARIIVADEVIEADMTLMQKKKVEAIMELIEMRDGQFVPSGDVSAYSLFNAVTAFQMHQRPARGTLAEQTETRLWDVLSGDDVISRAEKVVKQIIMS